MLIDLSLRLIDLCISQGCKAHRRVYVPWRGSRSRRRSSTTSSSLNTRYQTRSGVPLALETASTYDPTVGLYLGPYGGPRGGGSSLASLELKHFLDPQYQMRVRTLNPLTKVYEPSSSLSMQPETRNTKPESVNLRLAVPLAQTPKRQPLTSTLVPDSKSRKPNHNP